MSITTVGSALIHYEALGRGRPLIFVHGWLGSWRYWWPSMQALSTQYRTFAFDLWGFGDSSKNPDLYNVKAYVDMLEQFVDQLGVALPVALVGHSLGAAVAMRYASRHPQNVSRLVAVSLPAHGAQVNERLRSLEPDAVLSRILGKSHSFPEVEGEVRKTDPRAMNLTAVEMSSNGHFSELDKVNCKVMLVHGEHDPIVSNPSGEFSYLRETGQRRHFVGLDDASHFPMLEDAAVFNRLVYDFLSAGTSLLSEVSPREMWQRRTR